jgi:hypothetical protein
MVTVIQICLNREGTVCSPNLKVPLLLLPLLICGKCIIPNPLNLESKTSVESNCLEVVHTRCHPQVTLGIIHVDNMFTEVFCIPLPMVFFLHFQSSYEY